MKEICAISILCGLCSLLTDDKKYRLILNLCCCMSILLRIVGSVGLLTEVWDSFSGDSLRIAFAEETEKAQAALLCESVNAMTAERIGEFAAALGVTVEKITVESEERDGVYLPVRAELRGDYSAALSEKIEHELGIERGKQQWRNGSARQRNGNIPS